MESAGQLLKKARLEKGMSLEEVQKKTKIHLNILKAIEEEATVNLSPIYIRGFIKLYCKALGVDPKDFIVDYKEPQVVRLVKSDFGGESKEGGQSFIEVLLEKIKSFKGIRINKNIIKAVVIGLGAVIALIVVVKIGKFVGQKVASRPKKEIVRVVAPQEKAKKKAVKPQVQAVQAQTLAERITIKPSLSGPQLGIIARADCWVTLKTDGRLVFHSALKKGQSENWSAKERIDVSLSDAGVVDLVVNGERIPPLGKKGQARKNVVITKNGLNNLP
ncbi:MAG: RodZ domain-containing protein [Candidatus Omnitrophota bacterium]